MQRNNHRAYNDIGSRREVRLLVRNKQSSNSGTGEGTKSAREHSTDRNSRDIPTTPGRNLRQDTDLLTQGADIGETAESIGNDETRTVGEVLVGSLVLKGVVCDELVLYNVRSIFHKWGRGLTEIILRPISWPTFSRSPSRETPRRNAIG